MSSETITEPSRQTLRAPAGCGWLSIYARTVAPLGAGATLQCRALPSAVPPNSSLISRDNQ